MKRHRRIPGTTRPKALLVLPGIPDDAPSEIKNALAIRNACATEGACPDCGTVGQVTADDEIPGVYHWTFEHEAWCRAALDDAA